MSTDRRCDTFYLQSEMRVGNAKPPRCVIRKHYGLRVLPQIQIVLIDRMKYSEHGMALYERVTSSGSCHRFYLKIHDQLFLGLGRSAKQSDTGFFFLGGVPSRKYITIFHNMKNTH